LVKSEDNLLNDIIKTLEGKKAVDISIIEISDLSIIADYFVICTGTSSTHIKSLIDEVIEKNSEKWGKPFRIEGYETGRWVLLDYGEVIVHIFHNEDRQFYNLERLWCDAKKLSKEKLKE
jgi:ribosome-associated protein